MEAVGLFACEVCGRKYAWKSALAGRKVKCACGEEMIYPPVPPADGDDLYDIAEPPLTPPPPPPSHAASVAASPSPAAHPQSPPLHYQTPRTATDVEDEFFPDRTIDFHLPLALIAAGTLIEVVAALIRGGRSPAGFTPHLTTLGLQLILGTATMLAGVLVAVRFRGIELGKLPTALMKLAAISIAPGAVDTLLSPALAVIPFGGIFALIGQFVLYFALLGALFKLDESDTWYCVCVIFIINVAIHLTVLYW